MLTRREFGKLALSGIPAATVLGGSGFFTALAQSKPNSMIEGVQIGAITYSFRSMPDQSAEATLRYIVDSGISAIELMGGPIESYAGIPTAERGAAAVDAGLAGPAGRAAAASAAPSRRSFRPERARVRGTAPSA